MAEQFDAIVIGMGPGGEVAASRLIDAGKRVAVVERELIGGECGYWACIPSKTLLRSPEARYESRQAAGLAEPDLDWPALRDYRDAMIRHLDDHRQVQGYEDLGATVVKAGARVVGREPWTVEAGDRTLSAEHLVLATGSAAFRPPIDGLETVDPWTNREATTLTEIPRRAVLVGGSAVGTELGHFLARMGTRVAIVERGPRPLGREEPRVGDLADWHLSQAGVDVRTEARVEAVRKEVGETVVTLDDGREIRTDVLILATGRVPRVDGLGLEDLGVPVERPDGRAGIPVDEHCEVAEFPRLWAVGDVTGVAMFTHVAKYQGRVAADTILGRPRTADYTGVPRVVFAQPEIAAVGLTSEQARNAGMDVVSSEVDLTAALAKPWTFDTEPAGTLGLVADRRRRVLVGAWAVSPMAGEFIHTAATAVRAELPIDVLLDGIAQFPSYNEGFLAAAEQLDLD
ncbi:dihydrolipoyl dehydrogenase family protein [Salininema proteolyticum]|uniref:Dihydrolipoyl dehydrogenase family protein n=1 Tax=Salininema proteolyticum TaxID=1607685 RepID=A0ABV8TVG9_9ACTN